MKKSYGKRFGRYFLGVVFRALGTLLTLRASIGFSPWDVLHMGIADTVGMRYGTANSGVGFLLLFAALFMGEKIGAATLLNTICTGKVVDLFLFLDFLPANTGGNIVLGFAMMTVGLFSIAVGSFLYLGAELGSGPRDSLMVGLKRRFPTVPVGLLKGTLDGSALLIGCLLGGQFGFGTVYAVVATGIITQLVFSLCKFEVHKLQPESVVETLKNIFAPSPAFPPAAQEDAVLADRELLSTATTPQPTEPAPFAAQEISQSAELPRQG